MPQNALHLADSAQAKDLATLLSRARAIDPEAAVRLQARDRVLAVWVPVMSGETLLDQVPTVLGMRSVHLEEPSAVQDTVTAAALLDRLARLDRTGGLVEVPPVTVAAAWSGALPPSAGWEPVGTVGREEIDAAARAGAEAVREALPTNSGAAVVSTVRSRIWGSPTPQGFVGGAAFGADALGFNRDPEGFRIFSSGPWHRLSNRLGHVLARPATAL